MPSEIAGNDWTAYILAVMLCLAPAMGVPHEEMLQDTLKSTIVSFSALIATLLFFWQVRQARPELRWHGLLWLPLLLCAYALGSMAWSHAYLGGVEAVRWFIFGLVLWLGLNTLTRERLPDLAWAIHWGASIASLWTALQFWNDFGYFPQGPNPASTFINRNFFAELAVCSLPFSLWLLSRLRQSSQQALMAASVGFNVVAILMTGTRSAITALLLLALLTPLVLWHWRRDFGCDRWTLGGRLAIPLVLLGTVLALGAIPTGNARLIADAQGRPSALERGFSRVASVADAQEYAEGSFSVRIVMWKAAGRAVLDRPWTGVGAGAWEVDIPFYQPPGTQLETDYYVHNEFLQLLAEYGLLGWLVLGALLLYLAQAAWFTCRRQDEAMAAERPARLTALASLAALMVVSQAGFPWRLAATGALFAVALAWLAASDARLGLRGLLAPTRLRWSVGRSRVGVALALGALGLAAWITQQAILCESKIVRAVKIGLTISASPDPLDRRWDPVKQEMLALIREGIAINPHYRKLTPMVADELSKWGDWQNAAWIWESVDRSRPYVVAILANIARAHLQANENDTARQYLDRAARLQPEAPVVRSVRVMLLGNTGQYEEAARLVRRYFAEGTFDYDMVNAAYVLGQRLGQWDLAVMGLERRNRGWPDRAPDTWLKLGYIYSQTPLKDEARAEEAFRQALAAVPEEYRAEFKAARIPPAYQERMARR